MVERTKFFDDGITCCSSLKLFFVFLLKLEIVVSVRNHQTLSNHSCYTCMEPLVGYSKF